MMEYYQAKFINGFECVQKHQSWKWENRDAELFEHVLSGDENKLPRRRATRYSYGKAHFVRQACYEKDAK